MIRARIGFHLDDAKRFLADRDIALVGRARGELRAVRDQDGVHFRRRPAGVEIRFLQIDPIEHAFERAVEAGDGEIDGADECGGIVERLVEKGFKIAGHIRRKKSKSPYPLNEND